MNPTADRASLLDELRQLTKSPVALQAAETASLDDLRRSIASYRETARIRPEDRLKDEWSKSDFIFETK